MGYKMLKSLAGTLCNFTGGFMLGEYSKNTSNVFLLLYAIALIVTGSFLIIYSVKGR